MIARIWHGVTRDSESDEYFEYQNKTGVAEYRATGGVKRFAGVNLEKAKN